MTQTKRVALYVRVSTSDQTTENQLLDLQRYCSTRGWQLVETFDDSGVSGAKKNRPALDQLMAFVRARRCDCVLVWRYDRFARSVSHLVNALEEFRELGVDFASVGDGVDTGTSHGRLFFTFIAGIAEFEREIIKERIHAGLRRARASGKRLGRPGLDADILRAISEFHGQGLSARQIAARAGISKSAVSNEIRRLRAAVPVSINGGQNVA